MGLISRLFGSSTATKIGAALDDEETRTFQVLASLDRNQAMAKFPDFDVAYLRAAYPTGNSGDHGSAKPHILEKGIGKCHRKSLLLGRLSAYYVWKGKASEALQNGTNALLSTRGIPDNPGDLAGCLNLLHSVFSTCGINDVAANMKQLNPGYDESPEMQTRIAKIAKELSSTRHSSAVRSAADALRSKQL